VVDLREISLKRARSTAFRRTIVANSGNILNGGTVTKNGAALAPTSEDMTKSNTLIALTVGKHMLDKAGMASPYNPNNDALPGR